MVDKLAQEFDIQTRWLSFEIHPETPKEGILLTDRMPDIDWDELYSRLRISGKEFGIEFGSVTILSNSRLSMMAGEFALDHGKFDEFHENIFHAYFTLLKDIGSVDVLLGILKELSLDTEEFLSALENNIYLERLEKVSQEASKLGITGVPAFIINNRYKIVGAQPLDTFRDVLKRTESE